MKRTENPTYTTLNKRYFKEMGEEAFRTWCNETISNTKSEQETETLIAKIKDELQNESK